MYRGRSGVVRVGVWHRTGTKAQRHFWEVVMVTLVILTTEKWCNHRCRWFWLLFFLFFLPGWSKGRVEDRPVDHLLLVPLLPLLLRHLLPERLQGGGGQQLPGVLQAGRLTEILRRREGWWGDGSDLVQGCPGPGRADLALLDVQGLHGGRGRRRRGRRRRRRGRVHRCSFLGPCRRPCRHVPRAPCRVTSPVGRGAPPPSSTWGSRGLVVVVVVVVVGLLVLVSRSSTASRSSRSQVGGGAQAKAELGPDLPPPGVQGEERLAALGPHPPEGGVEGVGFRPVGVEAGLVVHLAQGGGSFTRPAILAACRGPETAARRFQETENLLALLSFLQH